MTSIASHSLLDLWTFPSMIRYRSKAQLSPATTTDEASQLSISSVSSPQPTNESLMIRARESPPKGLVEKRLAQFTQQVEQSASADEISRTPRSRSVPISAVLLNAQRPQSRPPRDEIKSPTRQVQIDMVRYDFRAPADLLRRTPEDPIGSECGEATTTTERLSDGETRMVRVIREIGERGKLYAPPKRTNGTDLSFPGRHFTQPVSRAAVRAAAHSISRGFPIVTVNVTDPKSSRRRTISDFPQPVVVEVRDDKSSRTTPIPVVRSPNTSPSTSAGPRRTTSRAVQIEKYDSRTLTIPPPRQERRVETCPIPEQEEELTQESSPPPPMWSPRQEERPMQPPDPGITRWENIDSESEISIKERELAIAKDTIKRLSIDLARLESEKQQLEIETSLQRQKSEAALASRVADAITQLRSSSTEPETRSGEKKRPTSPKFDPLAIKEECERMMEELRQEGGGEVLHEDELVNASEVDREIERLKREVSAKKNHSVMRTELDQKKANNMPDSHSIASTSGEDDDGGSDSSQIISLRDQVVMYSANGNNNNGSDKTSLINRLERELTDAQTCNLRLNQKIGNLVSSGNATLKKEILELKKDLKERTNEIDALKKKLQKADKDRQQWETQKRQLESKLPMDVQLLMAQKRELTMQLDREQNEKHELFLQINSMIAQLADTQPAGEVEKLKSENKELQRRVEELESSSAKESTRLEQDLQKARHESEVAKHQNEREKRQMQMEIEETKKELHMKAAALQSLMLATQDSSKADRMKEENEEMAKLLEETEAALVQSRRELEAKKEEIVQLRKSSEESSISSKQLEEFEKKLHEAEKVLKEQVASKETLMKNCERLIEEKKVDEEKLSDMESKYDEAQKTIAGLKDDIGRLEKEAQEEASRNKRWEFERDEEVKTLTERLKTLEATLKEKDSKLDEIRVQLLAAESRAEQADADLKAKEQVVINTDRRVQQLQAQLNAKGGVDEEVNLLRAELKKAEERHDDVVSKLHKAEAAAAEATKNAKKELEELSKKLEEASESETDAEEKIVKLQQQLQLSKNELVLTKEAVTKLEKQLADLQVEKKKLESKASVADEINTLMSSLSAVRAENGQFQEEIRVLHSQLEEVRDELERALEESDEWKTRAEIAEKERGMMEAEMSREHEKIVALTSSEESRSAHEAELASNTSQLKSENSKLQEETKGLRAELQKVQDQKKAAEEESMRKLRELTEKCEAIQKEADSSKSRVGVLEEEQLRMRSSVDQEKQHLIDSADKQRRKVEELQEEVAELKEKLKHSEDASAAEVERYSAACARLAEVEREYEEMKLTLKNTQGLSKQSSEKLQESENFALRIKQQLEELDREKNAKIQEMAAEHKAHRERLEQHIENMEKARQEQIEELERQRHEMEEIYRKRLEDAEKKLDEAKEMHRSQSALLEVAMKEKESAPKRELERMQKAKEEFEVLHKEQEEKLNRKINDLEARLTQTAKDNAVMVASLQDMSALLENEAKKREELSEERKKWMQQLNEKERELEEARSSSEGEEKINRLAAENVRLASEILKAHSQAEKTLQTEKDLITKQFADKLKAAQTERDKLASDMEALRAKMRVMESRIEDQRSSIEQAERIRKEEVAAVEAELDAVRKEKVKLKEDMENLRSNNNGNPIPPPRRTISNMSSYTYNTNTDFSEIEDVHRLRSEIDKQKRLIIVLRRKLQGLQ